MTLAATPLDFCAQFYAVEVLYLDTVAHQWPNEEERHFAETSEMQPSLLSPGYWCATIFTYNTFIALNLEQKSNRKTRKVIRLDSFRFLNVMLCETFCLFCLN